MPSGKLDLYRLHKDEYAAHKTPTLIRTRAAKYLVVQGRGKPGGEAFQKKIGALYNVAFTVKMEKKFAGRDYAVSKLEGIWWADRPGGDLWTAPRSAWRWKLLIRTPDFIVKRDLAGAVGKLREKGKPREVGEVTLERIREGRCVQVLHVGPYAKEPETVEKMAEFAKEKGLTLRGDHHEIYLSDPRRVPESRLRTILRIPVGGGSRR